jgi:hypothetical protein
MLSVNRFVQTQKTSLGSLRWVSTHCSDLAYSYKLLLTRLERTLAVKHGGVLVEHGGVCVRQCRSTGSYNSGQHLSCTCAWSAGSVRTITINVINMWHTQEYHISNVHVLERTEIRSTEAYAYRRQLRWLGHVSRMPWDQLPRKCLSSWVYSPRPVGGRCTGGGREWRTLKSMRYFKLPPGCSKSWLWCSVILSLLELLPGWS